MYHCLLVATLMLIKLDASLTNLGECPIYPRPDRRHASCYEKEACQSDTECEKAQKCCENPCGVRKCYEIHISPLEAMEICPVFQSTSGCQAKKTKFCYANNCGRCCLHEHSCNPAASVLTEVDKCFDEICSKFACTQQGEECLVNPNTHKPFCQCVNSCKSTQSHVCATNKFMNRTFLNICLMNKHACAEKETWEVVYNGRCKVVKKPVILTQKPNIEKTRQRYSLSSTVSILCYGDHKNVKLTWVQIRKDDSHYELPSTMVGKETVYLIKNEKRMVLALHIKSIGFGGYGTYQCRQFFNNSWLHDSIEVLQHNSTAYKRKWCSLPPDSGLSTCGGNFSNFYYDVKDNQCKSMFYNGCEGNENNFQTLEECEMRCTGKIPKNETFLIAVGERCENQVCRYFSKCDSSECVCTSTCSFLPRPVCGSDGKTYSSQCVLELHACKWRKPLTTLYQGRCQNFATRQPIANSTGTTKIPSRKDLCYYKNCQPYSQCNINPFTNNPQCICPTTCSFTPRILCASNMRLFINECFMKVYSCKRKIKLTVQNYGLCKLR